MNILRLALKLPIKMKRLFNSSQKHFSKSFYSTNEAFKEYTNTLKLPKTNFSQRSNPSVKEPEIQKTFGFLYKEQSKRDNNKLFILHDGPPFANGSL